MSTKQQYQKTQSFYRLAKRQGSFYPFQVYVHLCIGAGISTDIRRSVLYTPWCETRQVVS